MGHSSRLLEKTGTNAPTPLLKRLAFLLLPQSRKGLGRARRTRTTPPGCPLPPRRRHRLPLAVAVACVASALCLASPPRLAFCPRRQLPRPRGQVRRPPSRLPRLRAVAVGHSSPTSTPVSPCPSARLPRSSSGSYVYVRDQRERDREGVRKKNRNLLTKLKKVYNINSK